MRRFVSNSLIAALAAVMLLSTPAKALDSLPQSEAVQLDANAASFSDISPGQWFYSDVTQLAGLGALAGYPDGTFRPDSSITRAEYVKVIVSLLSIPIVRGDIFADTQGHWADPYIDAAAARGIVTAAEYGAGFYPDRPITRLEMMRIALKALSLEQTGLGAAFPDTSDKYASTALDEFLIYGIVEKGQTLFKPHSVATRAQTASVFMRIYRYSASPDQYKSDAIKETYVTNGGIVSTERDIYNIFNYMTYEGLSTLKVRSNADSSLWSRIFTEFFELNADRAYGAVSFRISWLPKAGFNDVTVTLTMDAGAAEKMEAVKLKGRQVISRIITDGMTPRQRAVAIHNFLVDSISYDTAATPAADSYTAYGALLKGKAVCQGYSAAFNILARMARLKSINAASEKMNHMWNVVFVEGAMLHLDATWDDPVGGGPIDKYLLKTSAQFKQLGYSWNEAFVAAKYFSYQ